MKYVKHQKGAVLIVSLVLLIIMTLLGISGMNDTVMQERMAGNQRNSTLAFQAAESALRAGEEFIDTWGLPFPSGDTNPLTSTKPNNQGVYTLDSPVDPIPSDNDIEWWGEDDFWTDAGSSVTQYAADRLIFNLDEDGDPVYLATNPAYVVEKVGGGYVGGCLDDNPGCVYAHYYQVTARGTGAAGQAESFLRSIYVRYE